MQADIVHSVSYQSTCFPPNIFQQAACATLLYVCMYVCMHACMYGWMHACMHVCNLSSVKWLLKWRKRENPRWVRTNKTSMRLLTILISAVYQIWLTNSVQQLKLVLSIECFTAKWWWKPLTWLDNSHICSYTVTFLELQEQFWSDALPDTTNDLYGSQS